MAEVKVMRRQKIFGEFRFKFMNRKSMENTAAIIVEQHYRRRQAETVQRQQAVHIVIKGDVAD